MSKYAKSIFFFVSFILRIMLKWWTGVCWVNKAQFSVDVFVLHDKTYFWGFFFHFSWRHHQPFTRQWRRRKVMNFYFYWSSVKKVYLCEKHSNEDNFPCVIDRRWNKKKHKSIKSFFRFQSMNQICERLEIKLFLD